MAELENVFHAITSKVPFANNNSNINVPSEEPASNVVIKKTVSAASEPLKTTTGHRPTTAINNVDKKTTGSTIAPVKKAVMTMQRVPLAPRPATAPPRAPMTMSMTTKPMSQVMKPPHMLGKGHSIIQLKSTWGNDTAARKKIMEQRRLAEVRSIQEAVQREAEMRKKVLTMRKEAESKKKQHERETFQAFSSDRSHATKEADRLKKERRKQSVLVNADILRKSRENAAAIEAAKKQEEADLLQTRHEDHLKVTEARKMEEQRRRESMVNRGLSAQQQREIMEQLVATKHDEEVSLLQSRREDFLKLTEARKMEEQRRRESMVNRGLTARQHQEIAEQMEQENHNEEVSLLDSRREDHLKMTEARRAEVQLRRESMVNRGLMAQQHRQIATQMEQEKHDEATDSLHFRRYLANQKAESEKDETRRSRESLAGRLDTWRAQRSVEERMDNARDEDDRSLLHTKHANWVDTNEHKKRLDTARRESLAVRLDEWRRQKVVVEKDNSEKSEAERIEWELKQQDAEDIKTYREVCRASRRESLAMRLDKARNDADVEEALRQQEAILMAEEYRLKDEDHAAVTKYRAEEDAARRKSLEFRNRQGHMERIRAHEEKEMRLLAEEDQHELSVQGWRDARDADEENKAAARRELAEKLVEDRKHHEHDLQQHQRAFGGLLDELQVRHSNWQDDQREKEAQQSRRRQSTLMRLDSWRRERLVEVMLNTQEQMMADEDARLREQDWYDLQEAKTALKMQERMDRLKGVFL